MKALLIITIFLLNSQTVLGEIFLNVKKVECPHDKEVIRVNECFVTPSDKDENYEFHFNVTYIKQIKSIGVRGLLMYKYSKSPRPLIRFNFNLCKQPKFRSVAEDILFKEIASGFHDISPNKLCPVQAGTNYYAEKPQLDPGKIPQFVPTGEFKIFVNFFDEKNSTVLELKIQVKVTKA